MQLVTWSGMDFNIPFLEPLLAQSGVSGASNEVLVGILFMIMAVAYIVISPIAGLLRYVCCQFHFITLIDGGNGFHSVINTIQKQLWFLEIFV